MGWEGEGGDSTPINSTATEMAILRGCVNIMTHGRIGFAVLALYDVLEGKIDDRVIGHIREGLSVCDDLKGVAPVAPAQPSKPSWLTFFRKPALANSMERTIETLTTIEDGTMPPRENIQAAIAYLNLLHDSLEGTLDT